MTVRDHLDQFGGATVAVRDSTVRSVSLPTVARRRPPIGELSAALD